MHRLTRPIAASATIVVALLGVNASGGTATAKPASKQTIKVGTMTLHKCSLEEHTVSAYCGSIKVPLNYNSAKDGEITVGFGWLPATGKTASSTPAPTIVTEEGGPGYPATGSSGDYQIMLGKSYLATHNELVVDERGTGLSTLINCQPLQHTAATSTSPALRHAIRKCGQDLNHEFPRTGGGYVHASDLFTTANSTRDMARVLNVLKLAKVDLYGDSYGTYFSQSFMSHFPQRLNAVVLDSAYEARDLDPWYITTIQTARKAFVRVCERSAACKSATNPHRAWQRISRLTRVLRAHPFSGEAPGVNNKLIHVTMNVEALVNLVNDAGYDYDPYRQLDAAIRAYLQHGDGLPLLRLYAQDEGYDYGGSDTPPGYYSNGQYYAISCTDYPQLFNMHDSSPQRRRQLARSIHHYPNHAFAPFTIKEWIGVDPFTEPYDACTSWPRQVHRSDPPVVPHQSMDASHVPVLILNGDIDSLTPAAGGAHIHRQIGPDSRHIVTANTVHLVAVDNSHQCGEDMVRSYLEDPAKFMAAPTPSCAARVPAIRTVGVYPKTDSAAQPVHGHAPLATRKLAAVALAAAGDAVHRFGYIDGNRDLGLRGGTIRYHQTSDKVFEVAHLKAVRWATDSTVTGHVSFVTPRRAAGKVTVRTDAGKTTQFGFVWRGRNAVIFDKKLKLHAPAP